MICFCTNAELDFEVIRTMGVSVKTNENPIGYFGTGLKYAIAGLLRTGHQMDLVVDDERYKFSLKTKEVRGKEFQFCMMNDEQLPFTTEFGKNWEPWQFYRELASNTMDEGGEVVEGFPTKPWRAIFVVTGDPIEVAHRLRRDIFIDTTPIAVHNNVEIHPGASEIMFYRGVRAAKLNRPTAFTYNILSPQRLTEDRTFDWMFMVHQEVVRATSLLENPEMVAQMCENQQGLEWAIFESEARQVSKPSKAFIDVTSQLSRRTAVPNNLTRQLVAVAPAESMLSFHKPSKMEADRLTTALKTLKFMGVDIPPERIKLAVSLDGRYGMYRPGDDVFYIAASTIEMGVTFLTATIFEEWVHMEHGLEDFTREFQDFVLQKLISVAENSMNDARHQVVSEEVFS